MMTPTCSVRRLSLLILLVVLVDGQNEDTQKKYFDVFCRHSFPENLTFAIPQLMNESDFVYDLHANQTIAALKASGVERPGNVSLLQIYINYYRMCAEIHNSEFKIDDCVVRLDVGMLLNDTYECPNELGILSLKTINALKEEWERIHDMDRTRKFGLEQNTTRSGTEPQVKTFLINPEMAPWFTGVSKLGENEQDAFYRAVLAYNVVEHCVKDLPNRGSVRFGITNEWFFKVIAIYLLVGYTIQEYYDNRSGPDAVGPQFFFSVAFWRSACDGAYTFAGKYRNDTAYFIDFYKYIDEAMGDFVKDGANLVG